MILTNVQRLYNKIEEIFSRIRTQKDFKDCCVFSFSETWLGPSHPDSAFQPPGFSIYRQDRDNEITGKSQGGGVCFLENNKWCSDVRIISSGCTPDLEHITIKCRPFYLPREFSSVIISTVYIHPKADTDQALNSLCEIISKYENSDPEALSIITGDFNQANLRSVLPNYHQQITCATRELNTLDHCYSKIRGAYKSIQRGNLGNSDHTTILLLPTYKQVMKQSKPVKATVNVWTEDAKEKLRGCFECTDWEVFNQESNLDQYTVTVTDYVKFCSAICLPQKTVIQYPNKKLWYHSGLKTALKAKDQTHKHRDTDPAAHRKAKSEWKKAVKQAKIDFKVKLESHFNTNDSQQMWSSINMISNYKGPKKEVVCSDPSLPDKLNDFYARFDRNNTTLPVPAVLDETDPMFIISEEDVRKGFNRLKIKKAAGPDGISPKLLQTCASQLAGVYTKIYNESLRLRTVPSLFKQATVIPVPKKNNISCLNDYRPVALTAVAMKTFERLVLKVIKSLLPPTFDPHQFAYRANRSVEDAISLCLHNILQHLETPSTYARILFIDYSSAFNTIIPGKLHQKLLTSLNFPPTLCDWILDFLTNRQQTVKVKDSISSPIILSTGAPQGCVLSPVLYSIFTFDCQANEASTFITKFADDTTICGLINNNDESNYRAQIESTTDWCANNNLVLNVSKTKEIIVDFRKKRNTKMPVVINGQEVEQVEEFKFLGTHIAKDLKWQDNVLDIAKKAHQRLYFLRSLKSFAVHEQILVSFYRAIIESILTRSITVWFGAACKKDLKRLNSVVRAAGKIIGTDLPSLDSLYLERTRKRLTSIMQDSCHPANELFVLLRSGRRLKTFYGHKRFINSFYPSAVHVFNGYP